MPQGTPVIQTLLICNLGRPSGSNNGPRSPLHQQKVSSRQPRSPKDSLSIRPQARCRRPPAPPRRTGPTSATAGLRSRRTLAKHQVPRQRTARRDGPRGPREDGRDSTPPLADSDYVVREPPLSLAASSLLRALTGPSRRSLFNCADCRLARGRRSQPHRPAAAGTSRPNETRHFSRPQSASRHIAQNRRVLGRPAAPHW
jgi:hypothetical protein